MHILTASARAIIYRNSDSKVWRRLVLDLPSNLWKLSYDETFGLSINSVVPAIFCAAICLRTGGTGASVRGEALLGAGVSALGDINCGGGAGIEPDWRTGGAAEVAGVPADDVFDHGQRGAEGGGDA